MKRLLWLVMVILLGPVAYAAVDTGIDQSSVVLDKGTGEVYNVPGNCNNSPFYGKGKVEELQTAGNNYATTTESNSGSVAK